MGGDPYDKFGIGPRNEDLMFHTVGCVVYLLILTVAIAAKGTDIMVVAACQAFAINWLLCGLVFGYEADHMGANVTEVNFTSFALAIVFFWLGFGPKSGTSTVPLPSKAQRGKEKLSALI